MKKKLGLTHELEELQEKMKDEVIGASLIKAIVFYTIILALAGFGTFMVLHYDAANGLIDGILSASGFLVVVACSVCTCLLAIAVSKDSKNEEQKQEGNNATICDGEEPAAEKSDCEKE